MTTKKKKVIKKKILKNKASPRVKRTKPKVKKVPAARRKIIGKVTHYFPHVEAAVVKLSTALEIGDQIHIKGHTTDFKQAVSSIQIDCQPLKKAKKGQEIGLLVVSRVRRRDIVYKA